MKVVLSWMVELAPDLAKVPVPEIAAALTDLGLAVEAVDEVGSALDGVVVAEVLATRVHPDADRVQLVDVTTGGDPFQVVCGAFNFGPGDRVPLATVGATLPNGLTLTARKVRGEVSNGMLCAADELGLGTDHSGIVILPADAPVGEPAGPVLGCAPDVVFDLEVNPNRPDAMSIAGVTRDVAARLGLSFSLPVPVVAEGSGSPATELSSVEIVDGDLCGRFVARVLTGVTVGPSPAWLARRLEWAGMRSINNVVDVSNYVMLELGQPNHAYDLDRLGGRGLRVRRAAEGETLATLDDVTRTCSADDLLICDAADVPVGLAGVMGGASSEISGETTDVLLELAWFRPLTIAWTSKRQGLRSEASARFERGCDPDVLELAALRFAELLAACSPVAPTLVPGVIDEVGPSRPAAGQVTVRPERVNHLLGTALEPSEMASLLNAIEFTTAIAGDVLEVDIPTFRPDCAVEVDVIEEIARHHGYSRIAPRRPLSPQIGRLSQGQLVRRRLRRLFAGAGCDEAMPLPFLSETDLVRAGFDPDACVTVTNPLVADERYLRPSLLTGLVKSVAYNQSHRSPAVRLFEIGHVFAAGSDRSAALPVEDERVAAIVADADAAGAKAVFDRLVDALPLAGLRLVGAVDAPGLHPTRSASVVDRSGDVVGVVGEVDLDVLSAFGVSGRAGYLELSAAGLLSAVVAVPAYRAVSRYPSAELDLAFAVDESVAAGDVEATLRAAGGDLIVALTLFDVYRGEGVAAGSRSLAWRVRLQSVDHTLSEAEVAATRASLIAAVEGAHPATLR